MRPLHEHVFEHADRWPDKAALIDGPTGRTLTYAGLRAAVRSVAAGLAARGFRKGDTFAIYSPNLPEYAVAFFGVSTAGGIVTTMNPLYTAEEVPPPARRLRRPLPPDDPAGPRRGAARGGRDRGGGGVRLRRGGREPRRSPRYCAGGRAAGTGPRPAPRSRRPALLERHDRHAQGRHALAPQRGVQPRADRGGGGNREGRRADRDSALLPHLRNGGDHGRVAPRRGDGGDDAALRPSSSSSA